MTKASAAVAVGPDLFQLPGQVAIVTGAGGPFGRSIAGALARAGADLFLTDVDPLTLQTRRRS